MMDWLQQHKADLVAAGLALVMAYLRGWHSGNGLLPRLLDAAMCSLIAFFLSDVLILMNLNDDWAMIGSVFIGYLGTGYLGGVLRRVIGHKANDV